MRGVFSEKSMDVRDENLDSRRSKRGRPSLEDISSPLRDAVIVYNGILFTDSTVD